VKIQSRRSAGTLAVSLFITLFALTLPVVAAFRPDDQRIPERYIVTFRDSVTDVDAAARDLAVHYDGTVLTVWKSALHGAYMRLSDANAKRLAQDGRVASVEQDALLKSSGVQNTGTCSEASGPTPADPLWHLTQISNRDTAESISLAGGACPTYQEPYRGTAVRVYVLDGGVLETQPELSGANFENVSLDGKSVNDPVRFPQDNFAPRDLPDREPITPDHQTAEAPCGGEFPLSDNPDDPGTAEATHGSAVTGFVVGRKIGVAKDAILVPVRIVSCDGVAAVSSIATMISGFEWVALHATRPAVVSISKSRITMDVPDNGGSRIGGKELTALETAVKSVLDRGIPVVASANNEMNDACKTTPARLSRRGGLPGGKVITVGGLNWSGSLWVRETPVFEDRGSNYGQCVDIWAPAAKLLTVEVAKGHPLPYITGDALRVSGTSYSAPMVAGVIARMMDEDRRSGANEFADPATTVDRVWERLEANATVLKMKPGPDVSSPDLALYLGGVTFKSKPTVSWNNSTVTLRAEVVHVPNDGNETFTWMRGDNSLSTGTSATQSNTTSTVSTHTVTVPGGTGAQEYWVKVTRTTLGTEYSAQSNRISIPNTAPKKILTITEQPVTQWVDKASLVAQAKTFKGNVAITTNISDATKPMFRWWSFNPTSALGTEKETVEPLLVENILSTTSNKTFAFRSECAICSPSPLQSDTAQLRVCRELPRAFSETPRAPRAYDATSPNPALHAITATELLNRGNTPLRNVTRDTAVRWYRDDAPLVDDENLFVRTAELMPPGPGRYKALFSNECDEYSPPELTITEACFHSISTTSVTPALVNPFQTGGAKVTHNAMVPLGTAITLGIGLQTSGSRSLKIQWNNEPEQDVAAGADVVRYTVAAVNAKTEITAVIRDTKSGCSRQATFVLYPCTEPFQVLAGMCPSPTMGVYVIHPGDTAHIVPVIKTKDGNLLFSASCLTFEWTWPGGSSAGRTLDFTADHTTYIDLKVSNGGYSVQYPIEVITLGNPCPPDCGSYSCKRRAIKVSSNPTSIIAIDRGASLTMEAPDNSPSLTYEWHYADNSTPNAVIAGASGATVTVNPLVDSQYWVIARSSAGAEMSDSLYAVINTGPQLISVDPHVQSIEGGGEARIDMTINIQGVNYDHYLIEWHVGDVPNGPNAPIVGNQRSLLYRPTDTTSFWCKVMDRDNHVIGISDLATVAVTCSATIQGSAYVWPDSQVSRNDRPWIQALAQGKLLTFEWQEQGPNDAVPHALGNGPMMQVVPTAPSTTYTAIATDACGTTQVLNPVTISVCKPTIDSIQTPPNRLVMANTLFTIGVVATPAMAGQHVTVNWYNAIDRYSLHPLVVDSPSLTTSITHAGTESYYAIATGDCGGVRSSDVVITACAPPPLGTGPSTLYIKNSYETATVWVQAGGEALTYQWYEGEKGDVAEPIFNSNHSSIIVHPALTTKYWCRITSRGLCTSDSETITVEVCASPAITTPPAGSNIFSGGTATMTVAASTPNGFPAPVYQWLRSDAAGNFTNISGANGASYTTPALIAATTYRVDVSSGACITQSDPVTIAICSNDPVVPGQTGINIPYAGSATLRLPYPIAGASPKAVFWYRGDVGIKTQPVAGPDPSDNITIPSITESRKYWAEITVEPGCTSRTNAYEVNVCVPTITANPQGSTINSGAQATLSVAANGGTLTYEWYRGQSGDTTNKLTGLTTASITVSPTADTTYWARVTGSCGVWRDSSAATVHICVPPAITYQTGNVILSYPIVTQNLAVQAAGDDLAYQWYNGLAGNTASPIQNATQSSIGVSGATTADYWVKVSGRCGSADSNTMKVSVPPVIDSSPAGAALTKGATKLLTVAARGAQLTYQWYDGTGATMNGATGASWTTPPVNADVAYWVRVKSGEAPADSAQAVLTVCQPRVPTITTNSFVSGSSITLRVDTVSGDETYEWYRGESGVTSALVGSGYQLSIPQYTTTRYWVRTKRATCDADSAAITVTTCVPAITVQPSGGAMINSGETRALSVTATGTGPLTYQWYTGDSGVITNPVNGATSYNFTTPALTATTKYWVQVKSAPDSTCGNNLTTNSATATVSVCQLPSITQQPFDNTLLSTSSSVTLNVAASGTGLSYQWYEGNAGVTTTPLGGTGSSLTVYPGVTKSYWVRVSGTCGSKDSNAALQSVPPTITTQPIGASVTKGTTKTLSVVASGTQLAYQWYSGASTLINGATNSSFPTPAINSDISYWVKVKSGAAATNSDAAVLAVCQPRTPVVITNNYTSGSNITLRVDTVGGDETYEWYRGESGVTSSPAGSGYQIIIPQDGTTRYWVRTKRTACDADSDAITVTTCYPTITTQPQGAVISAGTTKELKVEAKGTTPLTYQWYSGASTLISGATSASYTPAAPAATTSYWVQVKCAPSSVCSSTATNSSTATLTVCSPPAITYGPANNTIDAGQTVTLTVNATGEGLQYQWYEGAAGVTTLPVGTNSNTYKPSPFTTKSYWVRINGTCGTIDSAAALQSVRPQIVSQPSHATVCQNSTQNFTVGATGSPLTYLWQKTTGSTWTNVGTTASIDLQITQETTLMCTVTSGNASVSTWPATISIIPAPTIYSITKQWYGTTNMLLTANVAYEDQQNADYAWYSGAVGNTTTLLGNGQQLYTATSPSKNVWVRVTNTETGCWSGLAATVP